MDREVRWYLWLSVKILTASAVLLVILVLGYRSHKFRTDPNWMTFENLVVFLHVPENQPGPKVSTPGGGSTQTWPKGWMRLREELINHPDFLESILNDENSSFTLHVLEILDYPVPPSQVIPMAEQMRTHGLLHSDRQVREKVVLLLTRRRGAKFGLHLDTWQLSIEELTQALENASPDTTFAVMDTLLQGDWKPRDESEKNRMILWLLHHLTDENEQVRNYANNIIRSHHFQEFPPNLQSALLQIAFAKDADTNEEAKANQAELIEYWSKKFKNAREVE